MWVCLSDLAPLGALVPTLGGRRDNAGRGEGSDLVAMGVGGLNTAARGLAWAEEVLVEFDRNESMEFSNMRGEP